MKKDHLPDKSGIDRRLAAIEGHTKALRRMYADGEGTAEILQQIKAVREAWDKVAKIMILSQIEASVREGIAKRSAGTIFASLEETLARYFRFPAGPTGSAGRHRVSDKSERHRHLHRHPGGVIHSHDHDHGDHWHPLTGTAEKPPLHEH
ncbi:MAG: metal-sensing transcriptional repressor [Candidatus Eremiobacteraeota bacterium]|nr:metal-sensing transcriptional repressor [Candidatus Eremiobacteraeota bacterium]